MTSASIMEMQSTGYVASTSTVKASQATLNVQFSEAMEFASAEQQGGETETTRSTDEVNVHAEKSASASTSRKEIREVNQTTKAEGKEEVTDEQVTDELEVKEEVVVKEIAQQLEVSEEEVREAMEVLGLSVMDLMSQGNMVTLTAQITGMQPVDVLTDEQLFAQITDLTQGVQMQMQELADSLGMDVEQLSQMIEQQLQMPKTDNVISETEEYFEVTDFETETSKTAEPEQTAEKVIAKVQSDAEAIVEAVSADEETVSVKQTVNEQNSGDDVSVDEEFAEKSNMMTGVAGAEDDSLTDSESKGETQAGIANGQQMLQTNGNQVVADTADTVFEGRFDAEQTRELIDQISDYVKVNRTQQMTSMEIQLHPVELGTVNLQVVSKDGAVSAQLTVQDDAVRAALENQIVQLRESLQLQGLKIEAVEVTVATHEFEQNLDQHGKDAEEQAAREKKNTRKILDLNELNQEGMEDAEMSDADRLQIEMMRMGGNRLNFRV